MRPAARLLVARLLVARLTVAALVASVALVALPAAAGAATCPASGGSTVPEASASGEVVFQGHGWGHGLGMSQYGAQGAANLGCSGTQILERYYSGAQVSSATMPSPIQLRMLDNGTAADVRADAGAVTWELVGCAAPAVCPPPQPQGSLWRLQLNAAATGFELVDPAVPPVAGVEVPIWAGGAPGQELRLQHAGTVVKLTTWKGASQALSRSLRWDHTSFTLDGGALDAVQVIGDTAEGSAMDKYLWGVAEVPSSFPVEALKAQTIAARTYAAKRAGRVLQPTPADQNYTGYAKESEGTDQAFGKRWVAAVNATTGQVLKTAAGALVDTLYSSSFGGHSEDERYVWGVDNAQLKAVDDSRWDLASTNPAGKRSWAVGMSWAALTARLRSYGAANAIPGMVFDQVTSISVAARGSSARLAGVSVSGLRGCVPVTSQVEGWDIRQALGLLSPGFTIATPGTGSSSAAQVAACDSSFVPLRPTRLYDSRRARRPLGGNDTVTVTVAGRGGVPPVGAVAAALNVTAVAPSRGTYLTVWPAGSRRPTASSLSLPAATTRAALVTAAVGAGGRVSIFNRFGSSHVLVDVAGYYLLPPGPGQLYHPAQPFRLYDSRATSAGIFTHNATRTLTLPAIDGIAPQGMAAAVVNVTAAGSTGKGYLTAYPADTGRPVASTVNFASRRTTANRAVVRLAGGAFTVTNRGSSTHVVIDVVGYFAATTVAGGHLFRPLAPVRVLDTRTGRGAPRGAVGPRATVALTVARTGTAVPAGAAAVVMTLTATGATAPTYLTAWPGGTSRPLASDLNVRARETTANLVVVPVGAGGVVNLYNRSGSTHLVGDVVGYYR